MGGLYVGEAGVGAALLRAGQVLGNHALISAAEDHGRMISRLPWGSPDLFNGAAGRLRYHLWLWDETGAAEHLDSAKAAGEHLLERVHNDDDGARWSLGEGFESVAGPPQIGYAHGRHCGRFAGSL
jgi:lantibiotic modifying enzyme